MKRIFTTIMAGAAALVGMVSCSQYDDSALRDSLAGLTDRIDAIDSALNGAGGEIAALQELASKAEGYITVDEVVENTDGWTLVFSDGDSVVLRNGAKGEEGEDGKQGEAGENGKPGEAGSPLTIVLQNGVYYWAWKDSGELLKGTDGQPMPASSTPTLSVDEESGCWIVNGQYTDMPAIGGDSRFIRKVEVSDYYVYITLSNGYTLNLSRTQSGESIEIGDYGFRFLDTEGTSDLKSKEDFIRSEAQYVGYEMKPEGATVFFVHPDGWNVAFGTEENAGKIAITAPDFNNPIREDEGTIAAVLTKDGVTVVANLQVKVDQSADPVVYSYTVKDETENEISSDQTIEFLTGEAMTFTYTIEPELNEDHDAVLAATDGWVIEESQETPGQFTLTAPASAGSGEVTIQVNETEPIVLFKVNATAPSLTVTDQEGSPVEDSYLFYAEDVKTFNYTWAPADATVTINGPESWTLDYSDGTLTVTPPAEEAGATVSGTVSYTLTRGEEEILKGDLFSVEVSFGQAPPQPGDYYYADGTWSSALNETEDNPAIGVVFWIGTHTDGKLLEDYPALAQGGNHGLVVAFKNVLATAFRSSGEITLPSVSYVNSVEAAENASNTGEILSTGAYGYANTCLLRETNDQELTILTALDSYAETYACPAPENTSDWFIPSAVEMFYLIAGNTASISTGGGYNFSVTAGDLTNGVAVYNAIREKYPEKDETFGDAYYTFNNVWLSHIDTAYGTPTNPHGGWSISGSVEGPYTLSAAGFSDKKAVRPILAF
ncbi:MAG TPA: DUF4988 domain-containing protein [Candidatus Coprenecus stercoravium]|uniref:DUF4988 domain-containing protein n=1 Tax=Candidatus Coprenecus stercoravium TaxID=2840735 RepID=A0A9D2GR12_9BACT|nr:DUF4988 domain-containing protein [Candidatus Coprenecus stercoravium]